MDDQFYLTQSKALASVGAKVVDVKIGKNFGILLTDHGVACTWGDSRVGQLGRLCTDSDDPSPIDLNEEIIQIACGNQHALVLTSDREVFAFGRNKSGQMGAGDTRDRTKPVKVALPPDIHVIGCGPKSSFCSTLLGDVYQWGEVNKEMEQPMTKPHLHFSFDQLRKATRSLVIDSVADIDQRVIDNPSQMDTVKDQIEARKHTRENIWDLLRDLEEKEEDEQNENEETLPEHEAANEVLKMIHSIERNINETTKTINQCTKNIQNMEKQLEHNREQLAHLETQCVSLGDSADSIQVKMVDANGGEARKLQENLNYFPETILVASIQSTSSRKKRKKAHYGIKEFLDSNQNARMTLMDQKTEIEKEKQMQHETVIEKRKFQKILQTRLKIITELSKDIQSLQKASNSALQIAAECLEEFQQNRIHYNSTYPSFDRMRVELTRASEDLQRLRKTYLPQIEAASEDRAAVELLTDLFDLREQQHRLVEERWTQHDLDLSSFFEGAAKPEIVSELLDPLISNS
eukprot:GEMP01035318.1.p1 GENE.GEMP01035318.1~~GEMP01035318.1.p1  ORF type:complete len:520 (+),score=127.60 GEMP01035318.1:46-1605(+)